MYKIKKKLIIQILFSWAISLKLWPANTKKKILLRNTWEISKKAEGKLTIC